MPPLSSLPPLRSARLLDQLLERIRYDHCSLKTEKRYVHWVQRFVHFRGVRHPREMGASPLDSLPCAEPISSYIH
jgi:hypothetical protein